MALEEAAKRYALGRQIAIDYGPGVLGSGSKKDCDVGHEEDDKQRGLGGVKIAEGEHNKMDVDDEEGGVLLLPFRPKTS